MLVRYTVCPVSIPTYVALVDCSGCHMVHVHSPPYAALDPANNAVLAKDCLTTFTSAAITSVVIL